jgi:nitroimidazol reductase NimA-like FMN-containing flavoprotein (pyridoxamine 5'-phosphate oxidase superfamily)
MTNQFRRLMTVKADKELTGDELWSRIVTFLNGQTMCTLCTCQNDVPRATPLEYYLNETSLYMVGHKGIKLGNIKNNPKVSIGVYNHVHPRWGNGGNWLGVIGAQITGTARLIPDDLPEFFEAYNHFTSPTLTPAKTGEKPRGRIMIVVTMERIEYLDIALKLEGYASKQVWQMRGE